MPEHELHSVTVALRYQYTTYTDERHNNAEEKRGRGRLCLFIGCIEKKSLHRVVLEQFCGLWQGGGGGGGEVIFSTNPVTLLFVEDQKNTEDLRVSLCRIGLAEI